MCIAQSSCNCIDHQTFACLCMRGRGRKLVAIQTEACVAGLFRCGGGGGGGGGGRRRRRKRGEEEKKVYAEEERRRRKRRRQVADRQSDLWSRPLKCVWILLSVRDEHHACAQRASARDMYREHIYREHILVLQLHTRVKPASLRY